MGCESLLKQDKGNTHWLERGWLDRRNWGGAKCLDISLGLRFIKIARGACALRLWELYISLGKEPACLPSITPAEWQTDESHHADAQRLISWYRQMSPIYIQTEPQSLMQLAWLAFNRGKSWIPIWNLNSTKLSACEYIRG